MYQILSICLQRDSVRSILENSNPHVHGNCSFSSCKGCGSCDSEGNIQELSLIVQGTGLQDLAPYNRVWSPSDRPSKRASLSETKSYLLQNNAIDHLEAIYTLCHCGRQVKSKTILNGSQPKKKTWSPQEHMLWSCKQPESTHNTSSGRIQLNHTWCHTGKKEAQSERLHCLLFSPQLSALLNTATDRQSYHARQPENWFSKSTAARVLVTWHCDSAMSWVLIFLLKSCP